MKGIEIREYRNYCQEEILPLYDVVGWSNYTRRPDMLEEAFRGSLRILGAYRGELLVGLIRAVGDGASILYIQDLLVYPEFQCRGIGKALLMRMMELYPHVYQTILSADRTEMTMAFYKAVGLESFSKIGCEGFCKIRG